MARSARPARTPPADPTGSRSAGGCALRAGTPPTARRRLAETSEARALLRDGAGLPLGELPGLDLELGRLAKGGALSAGELLAVGSLARAVSETRAFLGRHAADAPLLAAVAATLSEPRALADAIDAALEPGGHVRDAASSALAAARREAHEAAGRVQERVDRLLGDRELRASLQDVVRHRARRPLRAAGARRRARTRAGHRARRLGLGHHALHRARGGGRAQQPPEAGGARDRARDAARPRGSLRAGGAAPRPRWLRISTPSAASISPSRAPASPKSSTRASPCSTTTPASSSSSSVTRCCPRRTRCRTISASAAASTCW